MPRITPLTIETAPPEAKELFEKDIAVFDQVLNSTAIAAYRPGIAQAAKQLGQAVAKAGLIPDQLRFLMNVRVAGQVGCPF
jgi:hypothetical protein